MIRLKVEDLGNTLDITIHDLVLFGKLDGKLLFNMLDSCGVRIWFGENEQVIAVNKNLGEMQFERLVQVFRRYDFSDHDILEFVDKKYVVEKLKGKGKRVTTYKKPQDVEVVDQIQHQEIRVRGSLGLYGDFDERVFFDALFYCGIEAYYEENCLIITIPRALPEWQAKRISEVLRRFRFSSESLNKLDGPYC